MGVHLEHQCVMAAKPDDQEQQQQGPVSQLASTAIAIGSCATLPRVSKNFVTAANTTTEAPPYLCSNAAVGLSKGGSDSATEHHDTHSVVLHFADCDNTATCRGCQVHQLEEVTTFSSGLQDHLKQKLHRTLENIKEKERWLVAPNHSSSGLKTESSVKSIADRLLGDVGKWASDNLHWAPAPRSNSIWWTEHDTPKENIPCYRIKGGKKIILFSDPTDTKRKGPRHHKKHPTSNFSEATDKRFLPKTTSSEWDLRLQAISELDLSRRHSGSINEGLPPLPHHFGRAGSLRPGVRLLSSCDAIREGSAPAQLSTINVTESRTGNGEKAITYSNFVSPIFSHSRSMDTLLGVIMLMSLMLQ